MKLISCLSCGVVINTGGFIMILENNLIRIKEEPDDTLKEEIYYDWDNIEQTEKEYLKYCPICNKWEFHKEVKQE